MARTCASYPKRDPVKHHNAFDRMLDHLAERAITTGAPGTCAWGSEIDVET
jgi:hypothetical protein